MPAPLYILIPIALGVATAVGMAMLMARGEERGVHDLFTAMAFISGGLGAFFASAVLLLTLVPGPGTGGPVQYSVGSSEAMSLFSFRSDLFLVGFAVLCVAMLQLSGLALSLLTKRRKTIGGSAAATAICWGALLMGFLTLSAWVPTA